MAHQVADTGWNSWSIWRATNVNGSNAQQWPPDPLPTNKHHCRKCLRVFEERREMAKHEAECLNFAPGESFLKYEKARTYDTSEKVIVSSQPPTTSVESLPAQPYHASPSYTDLATKDDQSATSMIKCEFCHREFKGKRGLKLHHNKCLGKKSPQQSSQQSTQQPLQQSLQQSVQQSSQLQADGPLETTPEVRESIENHENAVPELIDVSMEVSKAYEEIVLWRKNLFDLPKGHVGKLFVAQMTALVDSWNNKREYAMKALMIMPAKDISESKE